MKVRVFLDTNVFIYAFEFPRSNSNKIIELLNHSEIEAVISERVVLEVQRYFKKYYTKDLAALFRTYLFFSCTVIPTSYIRDEMERYKDKIKDKDLEHIAVVKKLGVKYLVSYDRDFEPFLEYKTPREFIEELHFETKEYEF